MAVLYGEMMIQSSYMASDEAQMSTGEDVSSTIGRAVALQ